MQRAIEEKRLDILKVLHEFGSKAISSHLITKKLTEMGYLVWQKRGSARTYALASRALEIVGVQ